MIGSTETEVTWNASMKFDPLDDAQLHDRVKETAHVDDAAADRLIAVYRKGRPEGEQPGPVPDYLHRLVEFPPRHRHRSRAQGRAGDGASLQILLPMVFAGA